MFSPCFPDSRMSLFSAKFFIWKQLLGEIFSFYKYGWLFLESVCYSQQSLYCFLHSKIWFKKRLFYFYSFGSYSSKSCIRTPQFQVFFFFFCIMKLIVIKIYPGEHKADEVCVLGRMAEERDAILFKIPDLLSLCSMVWN